MSGESLKEALIFWLQGQGGEVREQGNKLVFTKVLAERRACFAKRKTVLYLVLEPKEDPKELVARLSVGEKGAGLSPETGLGGKVEVYKVGRQRTGKVVENLSLPFAPYRLSFDYSAFQKELEDLAKAHGARMRWEILGP